MSGLGALSAERRQPDRFLVVAAFTFVFGAEFAGVVGKGAGPSRNGFLSGFFTLVDTHAALVTSGLIRPSYIVAQPSLTAGAHVLRRLLLAFGLLIVFLVITGSVWIIARLNANMMPMPVSISR